MGNIDTDKIRIEPLKISINPEILISFPYEYSDEREVLLNFSGELYTHFYNEGIPQQEDVKIANLYPAYNSQNNNSLRKIAVNTTRTWQNSQNLRLTAELSPKALEHIENIRTKTRKGDISLKLVVMTTSIESFMLENSTNPAFTIRDNTHHNYVTIKHSDWVHDFCSIFGIGNFFLFEYVMPENIQGSTDLIKKLNAAYKSIDEMKKHITRGEWKSVITSSRDVTELLNNKELAKEITNLIEEDTGSEEGAKNLMDSIGNLFAYASKFLKKTEKGTGNLNPSINPSKEDAYLVYTMSINIVSLISAKLNRSSS